MEKIIITSGDPAGCGPYIVLKAIQKINNPNIKFFVVGDYKIFSKISTFWKVNKNFELINADTVDIDKIKYGYPSIISGKASLNYIDIALKFLKKYKIKRLVTAPVSKEAIKLIYKDFIGHTEYLQKYFKVKNVEMMMVSGALKIVLFTRHHLLRNVSKFIKKNKLIETFFLVHYSLKNLFCIKSPKIVIASFNPHAGIDTFLGEEEKIIYSAINSFKEKLYGPYPADTLFLKNNLSKYDCFICLYHDQGMIPFKILSFKKGVNLTLGLPIIRTSPAHGVAYDVIRFGKNPFYFSMLEAIKLALSLKI
ncbi:MAG: 4-hydroxythreonine-4-phosphate dehydrogenase PdxA [Candidatus Omnitrophica bacterium]|nr:4-hydroxythreonine-4-phosphate dehydrogenase PdxA [Candidatus Omnitrophota bacterium]